MFYNPATYESNLISTISFYVFVALGLRPIRSPWRSGTPYFKEARQFSPLAQQNNLKGLNRFDGTRNRFLANRYPKPRTLFASIEVILHYHRYKRTKWTNPREAKQAIMLVVERVQCLVQSSPKRPTHSKLLTLRPMKL